MMIARRGRFSALWCAAALAACDVPAPAPPDGEPPPTAAGPVAADTLRFVAAAESVVAFLMGRTPLDTALLADSVVLLVAPEGGGATRSLSRSQAMDRAQWNAGGRSLVPAIAGARLTSRYGRHFNCLDYPLATRSDSLARRPHVGTMLRADPTGSCLQTWNATFVFAADTARVRLTHMLYDQWEW